MRSTNTESGDPAGRPAGHDTHPSPPDETASSAGASILARLAWIAVLILAVGAAVVAAVIWR